MNAPQPETAAAVNNRGSNRLVMTAFLDTGLKWIPGLVSKDVPVGVFEAAIR